MQKQQSHTDVKNLVSTHPALSNNIHTCHNSLLLFMVFRYRWSLNSTKQFPKDQRSSKKNQTHNSQQHRQSHRLCTMPATDNYTCEKRLTATGKVHNVHEGTVVKPMKSLPIKTLQTTCRSTHNKHRMLLRKSLKFQDTLIGQNAVRVRPLQVEKAFRQSIVNILLPLLDYAELLSNSHTTNVQIDSLN